MHLCRPGARAIILNFLLDLTGARTSDRMGDGAVIAFIVRRLLLLIPVLLIVGAIVFTLLHLAPGDPASMMLGREATAEQKEALREQLGLNEPLPVQFVDWFWGVLQLDFGDSLFIGKPVTEALLERVQPTDLLALYSLVFAVVIAVPAGSDRRRAAQLAAGPVPDGRLDQWRGDPGVLLRHSVDPCCSPCPRLAAVGRIRRHRRRSSRALQVHDFAGVTLGFSGAGLLARLVRSTMLDVLNEEYVRTAYAKGLPNGTWCSATPSATP